ncbi:hypothetical protein [Shinella sp.]|uniref:hypothetical protein n=1 Tax=Shinella sp. TaxID=1870904 RepID=UPI0039E35F6E
MTSTTTSTSRRKRNRRGPYAGVRHAPIRFTDERGRGCLKVPLDRYGRKYAIVTVRGYQAVQDAGATGAWRLNSNGHGGAYVRTFAAGTVLMPARIIAGAGPRSVVRYVNGDPLDLRPENIVLRKGAAKRADADIVADSVAAGEGGGW